MRTMRVCSTAFENRGPTGVQSAITSVTYNRLVRRLLLTQETLDVVYYYDAHGAFGAVGKDLGDSVDFLGFGKADHVVWRDELYEREFGRLRDGSCERGLAGPWWAVEQQTDERRASRCADLLDEELSRA